MARLEFYGEHCKSGVPVEDRRAFMASALARGYPVVEKLESNWRPLAIVGGGPSVSKDIERLRNWKAQHPYAEIWCVNAALDWLLERGVEIDGYAACDSHPLIGKYLANAPDGPTYYLSSTCHPEAFDAVAGKNVIVWHAGVNDLEYPKGHGVVGGGPTIMTRAPMLAYCLGYRDVHLFGADSSYSGGCSHAYPGMPVPKKLINVRLDGVIYVTEAELLHQAAYFQAIQEFYQTRGARFAVHGEGLGPAMLKATMHDPDELVARAERAA
jgi:hypothetical protein